MTSPAFSTAFAKEAFNVEAVPQVWVVEPSLHGIWTRDSFLPSLVDVYRITEDGAFRFTEQDIARITARAYVDRWTRDTSPSDAWTKDTFVPVMVNVRRITEPDPVTGIRGLRFTQQRDIRITQRAYVDPWIKDTRHGAAWSRTHA
jgi:hypothetical protein